MHAVPGPTRSGRLPDHVIGVVLAGGASARFGSDKAVANWIGMPLASRPMRALYGAGAARLVYVATQARDEGTFVLPAGASAPVHVRDEWPGQGPLGAIITALRAARRIVPTSESIVVAACDLPNVTSTSVAVMVNRLMTSNADIVVPRTGGRLHWSLLALRISSCLDVLTREFELGERAVHRGVAGLERMETDMDDELLLNVNDRTMLLPNSSNR